MTPEKLSNELINQLIPSKYKKVVKKDIPESWLLLQKGSYFFVCFPFSEIDPSDYGNSYVKKTIEKRMKAKTFFSEKGVFILYYGPISDWIGCYQKFQVDRTALRPVIVQSVHFLDLEIGINFNKRNSWGPLKFGSSGSTIKKIEKLGNMIKGSL